MAEGGLGAFLHDAESRRVAQELGQDVKVRRGTMRQAAAAYRTERSPDILLVDLDGDAELDTHVPMLMQVCRPESTVLVTGSENSVDLANELYRHGVFLYLPKPLDVTNLRHAMREVDSVHGEGARPDIKASRLVPILGKGMGVNTMAVLLAKLAAGAGRYVSCLDLDPHFGTLAAAMGVTPQDGLRHVLHSENAEAEEVERLRTPVSQRIEMVGHPMEAAGQDVMPDNGLQQLIDSLSTQAHMILGCGFRPMHVETLRPLSTTHLIVFEPTPSGISIAVRWMRILDGAPATLVMNHTRPMTHMINNDQLRGGFGGRLPDFSIPYIKGMPNSLAVGNADQVLPRAAKAAIGKFLQPILGLGIVVEESG